MKGSVRWFFRQRFFPGLPPFLFPFGFGGVGHPLLFMAVLHEQQQVVGDGHKMRLHLLGRGARRPGFVLRQFGLGFVKDLLDLPAGFVEQHQQARRRRQRKQALVFQVGRKKAPRRPMGLAPRRILRGGGQIIMAVPGINLERRQRRFFFAWPRSNR